MHTPCCGLYPSPPHGWSLVIFAVCSRLSPHQGAELSPVSIPSSFFFLWVMVALFFFLWPALISAKLIALRSTVTSKGRTIDLYFTAVTVSAVCRILFGRSGAEIRRVNVGLVWRLMWVAMMRGGQAWLQCLHHKPLAETAARLWGETAQKEDHGPACLVTWLSSEKHYFVCGVVGVRIHAGA